MQNLVLNKRQMKCKKHLKMFNFRFIAFLCISVFFQHLSFATEQKKIEGTELTSRISYNNHFENGSDNQQETQLHIFVEAESEDEDDIHNEKSFCNDIISSNQNFKANIYTNAVKTLYLRLAFLYQHKVELPFFILYHSWKSHLA